MIPKSHTRSQRGEIATILTAIAVVVLTVGVALGVTRLKAPQREATRSEAQIPGTGTGSGSQNPSDNSPASPPEGSCTYQSFTHVYKEAEPIFFAPTEIGQMRVVNDRGGALVLDENDRSQRHYLNGEFPFDPERKTNYAENDPASLSLEGYDRTQWKVKSVFCTNRGIKGCPEQSVIDALNQRIASGLEDGSRIEGFRVNCGVDVTYGWVLTNSPSTLSPAPTPAPTTVPTQTSCPYTSTSHVYKGSKGTPLPLAELGGTVLTVTNDRNNVLQLNQNGLSTNSFTIDPMPFDPTGTSYYPQGAQASVTLGKLPEGYAVKSVFCDQAPGSTRGCPLPDDLDRMNNAIAQNSSNGLKIDNFRIDCNVNTTYGWIVEPATSGVGSMEVRVEALNYPQNTPIWDKDDIASNKPGSCTRQQTGEQRPLYLSPFKLKATCESGPCKGKKYDPIQVGKREGHANFEDLAPGNYSVSISGISDRGYELWDRCDNAEWKVEAGKKNQLPILFLVNKKDGVYDEQPTEKTCKDAGGVPNLVEGLSGNVCYYKDGKEPDPTPGPTDSPDPKSSCEALEDGSDGICVEVINKNSKIKSAQIFPNPLIQSGQSEQTFIFNGSQEKRIVRFKAPINTYQVYVRNVAFIDGGTYKAYATSCAGGRVENDPAGGGVAGSQVCIMRASKNARVTYELTTADGKEPDPTPDPDPDKHTIGKCVYITSEGHNCSLAKLSVSFGDLGDDVVKKMSAICHNESGGRISAPRKACLHLGDKCSGNYTKRDENGNACHTYEYSLGLLQVNMIMKVTDARGNSYGPCVEPKYASFKQYQNLPVKTKGPICTENANTQACVNQVLNVDNNLSIARAKYNSAGYLPWCHTAYMCGYITCEQYKSCSGGAACPAR